MSPLNKDTTCFPEAYIFRIETPAEHKVSFPKIRAGAFSYTFRQYMKDRLLEVYQDASKKDWDDEGAEPVSIQAMVNAERFVEALPDFLKRPSVFPQSNGKIGIQWSSNSLRDALVVSIDQFGGLTYAAICSDGTNDHGFRPFSGPMSRNVLEHVVRFKEPVLPTAATGT